jgi:hypothetical protein
MDSVGATLGRKYDCRRSDAKKNGHLSVKNQRALHFGEVKNPGF